VTSNRRQSHSLRTRYLLLIASLGVVVFVTALWGHHTLNQVSTASTQQLQARQDVTQHSRMVRVEMFESYKSLNAFLLDPSRKDHRQRTLAYLNMAIIDSDRLLATPWITLHRQQDDARALKDALVAMGLDIASLAETRTDPTRQYPSMAASNRLMQPNRNRFNNAIALALGETSQLSAQRTDVLEELIEVRHLWTQMVSNFRIYLANRMGSFNEAVLPKQEQAVITMQDVLAEYLARLAKRGENDELGFETTAAVQDMIEALAGWYAGFTQVKAIHGSTEWRADVQLIKERIEPNLALITAALGNIEQAMTQAVADDLTSLTDAIQAQTRMAWMLGVIGLLFIGLIIVSLDHLVFRPIRLVADGLKAEAFGKEGVPLPKANSLEAQNLIDAFTEMRNQVHQRQTALQHQATHDALTDLPNRSLLQDRLDQAIQAARRHHTPIAFMMLDLDRFKDINDTLGHHVGDQLLGEIGNRLNHTLREADTIARLGGDEFGVLLLDTDRDSAPQVAGKITEALTAPFQLGELRLYIGASIGIAVYPDDGEDATTLVQRADVAMYMAKRNQTRHALYQPDQDTYSIGRLALMGELRTALQRDSLALHYQPKLRLSDGKVTGAEALLRWNHPEYGAIPPDQVVALAEHTGQIGSLTYWVLNRALSTAAGWHRDGQALNLAVNLSVHNLRDHNFQQQVRDCLAAHRFPAESLTLEITEHAMMANPTDAIEVLKELDVMGVRLAVDDYGTGFSSLAYLKQLPVDELKIDKSFVMRMHRNPNDEVIVRSTIELAHNLGLRVVAEGVESAESWGMLKRFGCETAQGFHMSRPLPAEQFNDWLAQR